MSKYSSDGATRVFIAGGDTPAPIYPAGNLVARINGGYWRQVIMLTGPTSGQVRLAYKGQTTGDLAYNASPATVQTALAALSTIGSGNVTVAGGGLTQDRQIVTLAPSLAEPYTFITGSNGTSAPSPAAVWSVGALVKDVGGILHTITLGTHSGGGAIDVYDAAGASDARNLIAKLTVPSGAAPATYTFDATFATGLVIVCPSTMDLSVSYR